MPQRTVEAGKGNSATTERNPQPGSGGVKDNVQDELEQAAGQGTRGRTSREKAALEEAGPPGSGGVKDNVADELAESQEPR